LRGQQTEVRQRQQTVELEGTTGRGTAEAAESGAGGTVLKERQRQQTTELHGGDSAQGAAEAAGGGAGGDSAQGVPKAAAGGA
jgi:hypothetical protein